MARQKGTFNLGSNIENLASAPLDARMLVKTKAELTDANSFPYFYQGMIVSVQSENKVYYLIGNDPTTLSNWKELGSGTENNIVEGYFNSSDNLFYADSAFTTPITGEIKKIYVSLNDDNTYRYDNTNSIFVRLDDEEIDYFQKTSLPTASADYLGKVYQYIGSNTADYMHGFFYECFEDEDVPGVYYWEEVETQEIDLPEIQVKIMPQADSESEGRVVHYLGPTDFEYTHGYFYECYNSETSPGNYYWEVLDVQPIDLPVIQVWTMPTAESSINGRIVQYVGTTTEDYHKGYFYECIESGTPGIYEWENINVQHNSGGGGGGDAELTKAITATINVGGISIGTNYPIGTEIEHVLQDLLEPVIYPTFVSPSATLSYSINTYYEVGSTIPAKTATVIYDAGAINLNGVKQDNRGGAALDYDFETIGADVEYNSTGASSGTFSVPALTKSTKGTIQFVGSVDFDDGPQPKDSKGNDYDQPFEAATVTTTKTATFILNFYYGISSNSTISDFSGLNKNLSAKGNKTFSFTTNNQYMVFAYDSDYGNLKSILDSNGFETISGWNKTTIVVNGFSYNVYMPKSPTTDTNAAFTFKF